MEITLLVHIVALFRREVVDPVSRLTFPHELWPWGIPHLVVDFKEQVYLWLHGFKWGFLDNFTDSGNVLNVMAQEVSYLDHMTVGIIFHIFVPQYKRVPSVLVKFIPLCCMLEQVTKDHSVLLDPIKILIPSPIEGPQHGVTPEVMVCWHQGILWVPDHLNDLDLWVEVKVVFPDGVG